MNTVVGKSLLVKIQGDTYSFDIAETKYDNQLPCNFPNKEDGIKLKHYVCNKN